MTAAMQTDGRDLLLGWIEGSHRDARRRTRRSQPESGLRFAFYGRISTQDLQDRLSSSRWQRDVAQDLIAGRGRIVAEYFDVSYSRRLPWTERPQATALLAAIADAHRGFDAVVVGELERAFYGNQLAQIAPVFERYGVQLWLPEVDGPVDRHDPTHQALMLLLGVHSKREVLRSRHRVLAAMRTQVIEQGRHLGGRPPYGYRLVDAGPHPNRRPRPLGPPAAPPRTRPGDRPTRHMDLRPTPRRPQRRRNHPRPQRARYPLPLACRPGPQPPPHRPGVDAAHRRRHPRQPLRHARSTGAGQAHGGGDPVYAAQGPGA